VTPDRIRENLDVFGFSLDDDEVQQISHLSNGQRIGPDTETFNSL
jgi:diketogulonate reductase-like aldo/keto reductase